MLLKIVPLCIFFILYLAWSPDKYIVDEGYTFFQNQEMITKTLVDRYKSGPLKNISACFKRPVHEDYYNCNMDAFICSFKQNMGYPLNYKDFYLDFSSIELISSQTHHYYGPPSYIMKVEYKKTSFYVLFPKRCHVIQLPENQYTFHTTEQDLLWDNYGQSILIDKFLVRQKHINEWVALIKNHIHLYSPFEVELPARKLNVLEKHEYCAFMQGKVLEMNVYDAMTSSPTLFVIHYPWSEFSKDGSLCRVRYTKECVDDFIIHYPYSPTSYGVYESLGPYPQFVHNFYEPLFYQNFSKEKSFSDQTFSRKFKEQEGENTGFRCQYND